MVASQRNIKGSRLTNGGGSSNDTTAGNITQGGQQGDGNTVAEDNVSIASDKVETVSLAEREMSVKKEGMLTPGNRVLCQNELRRRYITSYVTRIAD
ncbi:hypothetical protein BV898_14518 [Hypsibius exemplaris]|uniref:Uncharacterized protein n=1 Tax=Hypsibius exemplaris TaxID=2072580 RepID=A0A9X6RJH8_HYPEX|nr:hypothetical protein BV898_14518 [Hypsibius exemplaris]